MEWLIEDALPPAPLQAALAPEIVRQAPHLLALLQGNTPARTTAPPGRTFCTPAQAWLVQRAGFVASTDLPEGSAWPALQDEGAASAEPVWWAQPCHMAVSQHGVSLLEPQALAVLPAEAEALLQAIAPDLAEAGIVVQNTNSIEDSETSVWRWQLPNHWNPQAPTMASLAGQDVHTWWSQDESSRPWRRLLNLIQMVWHEHPVNVARRTAGQAEINSVWLQGGARPEQLPARRQLAAIKHFRELAPHARANDWGGWLQALAQLDEQWLAQIAKLKGEARPQHLILTGHDSWLTLPTTQPGLLKRWLSRSRVIPVELLFEAPSEA